MSFCKDNLSYDSVLVIQTNFKCTLKCKYCTMNAPLSNNSDYLIEDIKRDVNYILSLSDCKLKCITVTGGEPFLYYAIEELIEFLETKDIPILLQTNGTLLKKNKNFVLQHFKKDKKNVLRITNFHLEGVLKFCDEFKDKLNFFFSEQTWTKSILDLRQTTLKQFRLIDWCCKNILLYQGKVFYCYRYLGANSFIKHPENLGNINDLQRNIKDFKSISEIVDFEQKRNRICNGCKIQFVKWSQDNYLIDEVLIQ